MPGIRLDGTSDDIRWVTAIMTFPRDENLRTQWFTVHNARARSQDAEDRDLLQLNAKTLRVLLNAPSYEDLRKLAAERTKQAIVAGDILSVLFLMDRFSLPEPSMNKAIHVARQYAINAKYGDGTRLNISEFKIREYWEEFRPVAHLWAAFRLNRSYPFCPEENVFTENGFAPFLEVAAALYGFGCSFIPERARLELPLLDAEESWSLPDGIKPRSLQIDGVPDGLQEFLQSYSAPLNSGYRQN